MSVPELPRNGLPGEDKLRAVIAKALAPKRDNRYPSAAAMQRDLDGLRGAAAKLMTSPLALGEWLKKTFGEEIWRAEASARRRGDRGASERGAPLVLQAIAAPPPQVAPGVDRALAAPAPMGPGAPLADDSRSIDLGPYAPRPRRRTMIIVFLVAAMIAAIVAGAVAASMRQ